MCAPSFLVCARLTTSVRTTNSVETRAQLQGNIGRDHPEIVLLYQLLHVINVCLVF